MPEMEIVCMHFHFFVKRREILWDLSRQHASKRVHRDSSIHKDAEIYKKNMAHSPVLIQVMGVDGHDNFLVHQDDIVGMLDELFASPAVVAQSQRVKGKARARLTAPVPGGRLEFDPQGQDLDKTRLQQLSVHELSREFTRALLVAIVLQSLQNQKKPSSTKPPQQYMMIDPSLQQHVVIFTPQT